MDEIRSTIRCNMCLEYFRDEDELETFEDKKNDTFKGCPICETDEYLMDLDKWQQRSCPRSGCTYWKIDEPLGCSLGDEKFKECNGKVHYRPSELQKAYDVLKFAGIPKPRAGTVAGGIQVLMDRYNKQIQGLTYEIEMLKKHSNFDTSKGNRVLQYSSINMLPEEIKEKLDTTFKNIEKNRYELDKVHIHLCSLRHFLTMWFSKHLQ